MTNFIDSIKVNETGIEYPVPFTMSSSLREESPESLNFDTHKEYEGVIQYKYHFKCNPRDLHVMVNRAISQFKREVYNDFIDQMYEIERNIYSQDYYEIKKSMDKLWEIVRG